MESHIDRRLHRSRRDRVLFGVCSGLGEYFEIDPVLIRLGFVLITLAGGAGILAYLALAIVLPEEGAPDEPGQAALRRNLESLRANAGELTGDLRAGLGGAAQDEARATRSRQVAGLLLIGLGLLFLAGNLGWLAWWTWREFWPVVLIVLGLAILLRRAR
jgi:phage shock protein C